MIINNYYGKIKKFARRPKRKMSAPNLASVNTALRYLCSLEFLWTFV